MGIASDKNPGVKVLLPGNKLPCSLQRMKTLMGVQDNADFYWHTCSIGNCSWRARDKVTNEEKQGPCPWGESLYQETKDVRGKVNFVPHMVSINSNDC